MRADEAAAMNLQATDLVGEPAEDNEERRPDEQRDADQQIGGLVEHLERDGQEEQRVELPVYQTTP